jgi:GNAT superfamily N-acetyltransferase
MAEANIIEVTTYYLEMKTASSLQAKNETKGLEVQQAQIAQFQFNRFLYGLVGRDWQWTGRDKWTDQRWEAWVGDKRLRTWAAYYKGTPAGFCEMCQDDQSGVEIVQFGLAPAFIGQGFGGYFLSRMLEAAWKVPQTQRVWLHTCTMDHPHALDNYKARGLEVYQVETSRVGMA